MAGAGPIDDGPIGLSLDVIDRTWCLADVRGWTRKVLSGVSAEELEDVLLVVHELVSNAFDHGRRPCQLRLHRSAQPGVVRVEVDDVAPDSSALGSARAAGRRGSGMFILNCIASDWGVTPGTSGKTVWAEVPCATG